MLGRWGRALRARRVICRQGRPDVLPRHGVSCKSARFVRERPQWSRRLSRVVGRERDHPVRVRTSGRDSGRLTGGLGTPETIPLEPESQSVPDGPSEVLVKGVWVGATTHGGPADGAGPSGTGTEHG
jgi:hypothetical protein